MNKYVKLLRNLRFGRLSYKIRSLKFQMNLIYPVNQVYFNDLPNRLKSNIQQIRDIGDINQCPKIPLRTKI